MSAKMQFLNKLQASHSSSGAFANRSQADIAAFRQRMAQLQTQMAEWLAGTGLKPESATVSLTDLLAGECAFDIPAVTLRHENRRITFTPLFLYGHGVTGCVEARLYADGKITPLGRLFMRAGQATGWTCSGCGAPSRPERAFDEEAFFGMAEALLSPP